MSTDHSHLELANVSQLLDLTTLRLELSSKGALLDSCTHLAVLSAPQYDTRSSQEVPLKKTS